MATLQVRDMDDRLYDFLKTSAKLENRSISQEVITIIQKHLNSNQEKCKNSTLEFLSMNDAWIDDRDADVIIDNIRNSRNQSERFGGHNGLFD